MSLGINDSSGAREGLLDLLALSDFLLQLFGTLIYLDPQFLLTLLHLPNPPEIDRYSKGHQKEGANTVKPPGLIKPGSQIKAESSDFLIPSSVPGGHDLEAIVSRR